MLRRSEHGNSTGLDGSSVVGRPVGNAIPLCLGQEILQYQAYLVTSEYFVLRVRRSIVRPMVNLSLEGIPLAPHFGHCFGIGWLRSCWPALPPRLDISPNTLSARPGQPMLLSDLD